MPKLLWWIALKWVLLSSDTKTEKREIQNDRETNRERERERIVVVFVVVVYSWCARVNISGRCSLLLAVTMTTSVTIMKIVLIKWNEYHRHHHHHYHHKTEKNCINGQCCFNFQCFSMCCNGKHTKKKQTHAHTPTPPPSPPTLNQASLNSQSILFILLWMHREKISKIENGNARQQRMKQTRKKISSWIFLSAFRFSYMDSCGQKRYTIKIRVPFIRWKISFLVIFFWQCFFFSLASLPWRPTICGFVQLTRSKKQEEDDEKNEALKKTFAWCTNHFGFIVFFFGSFCLFF